MAYEIPQMPTAFNMPEWAVCHALSYHKKTWSLLELVPSRESTDCVGVGCILIPALLVLCRVEQFIREICYTMLHTNTNNVRQSISQSCCFQLCLLFRRNSLSFAWGLCIYAQHNKLWPSIYYVNNVIPTANTHTPTHTPGEANNFMKISVLK